MHFPWQSFCLAVTQQMRCSFSSFPEEHLELINVRQPVEAVSVWDERCWIDLWCQIKCSCFPLTRQRSCFLSFWAAAQFSQCPQPVSMDSGWCWDPFHSPSPALIPSLVPREENEGTITIPSLDRDNLTQFAFSPWNSHDPRSLQGNLGVN